MTPDRERASLAHGVHPKAGTVRPVTRAEATAAMADVAVRHEGRSWVWCLLGRAPAGGGDPARNVWTVDEVTALITIADRVAAVDPATSYDPPPYLAVVAGGELYQFSLTGLSTYADAT